MSGFSLEPSCRKKQAAETAAAGPSFSQRHMPDLDRKGIKHGFIWFHINSSMPNLLGGIPNPLKNMTLPAGMMTLYIYIYNIYHIY